MSYLEYRVQHTPRGLRKVLHLNWPLTVRVTAAGKDSSLHRRPCG